jgi:hypothetical protein
LASFGVSPPPTVNALEEKNVDAFWAELRYFIVIATLFILNCCLSPVVPPDAADLLAPLVHRDLLRRVAP